MKHLDPATDDAPLAPEEDLFSIFGLEGLSNDENARLLKEILDRDASFEAPLPTVDFPSSPAAESQNPLSKYYRTMAAYPPLGEKELGDLILKSREVPATPEAESAREKAIYSNLRLAWSVAKRYSASSPLSFQDLLQEGVLGLSKAVDRFDPSRKVHFSTYAYYWIEEAIRSAIREERDSIRLPDRLVDLNRVVRLASDRLTQTLGREPSVPEIAQDLNLEEKEVSEALEAFQKPVSLDDSVGDEEDGDTLSSFVPDPDSPSLSQEIDEEDSARGISNALEILSDREKDIIMRNFGLGGLKPESLEAIGKGYGVSRERIRQIREGALEKMAKLLREKGLE